jgi:hypothetical protein
MPTISLANTYSPILAGETKRKSAKTETTDERLTLHSLLLEEILRHDLDTVDGRQSIDRLGQVLQDKTTMQVRVFFENLLALMAMAATYVDKEWPLSLRSLHDFDCCCCCCLVEDVQIIEPVRRLQGCHEYLQGVEVLGMLGQPLERAQVSVVALLERSVRVRRDVRVVVVGEE